MLDVSIACGLGTFLFRVFDAVYRENSVSHVFGIATRKNSLDARFPVIG